MPPTPADTAATADTADTAATADTADGDLRSDGAPGARVPLYPALRECLRLRAGAAPPSLFSRLFGVDPLARTASRAYRGALAELAVARVLSCLGDGWTVLHAVPAGEDSPNNEHHVIEHLVIGPSGIFSIVTRNHAAQKIWVGERTFMADGERYPYIPLAEADGAFVTERMLAATGAAARVTPCIVLVDPSELIIRQRPGRVEVVTSRAFGPWLRELPRLLSPSAVDLFAAAASREDIWPQASAAPIDTREKLDAFERLRRTVNRSRRRRLTWIWIGVGVCYGILFARFGGLALFGV